MKKQVWNQLFKSRFTACLFKSQLIFLLWFFFYLTYSIPFCKKLVPFLLFHTKFTFLLDIRRCVTQHWPSSAVVVIDVSWGMWCPGAFLMLTCLRWQVPCGGRVILTNGDSVALSHNTAAVLQRYLLGTFLVIRHFLVTVCLSVLHCSCLQWRRYWNFWFFSPKLCYMVGRGWQCWCRLQVLQGMLLLPCSTVKLEHRSAV